MSGGELLQINPFGFIIATARRLWMVPRYSILWPRACRALKRTAEICLKCDLCFLPASEITYPMDYPDQAVLPRVCLASTYISPIDNSAVVSKLEKCFKNSKTFGSSRLKHLECLSLGWSRCTETLVNHSSPSSGMRLQGYAAVCCVKMLFSALICWRIKHSVERSGKNLITKLLDTVTWESLKIMYNSEPVKLIFL